MVSVWASMVPGLMSGKCVGEYGTRTDEWYDCVGGYSTRTDEWYDCVGGYSTRTDERWLMNNECGYDVTGTFGVFACCVCINSLGLHG